MLKSDGVVAMRKKICTKECGKRFDELPKLESWIDEPFIAIDMSSYNQKAAEARTGRDNNYSAQVRDNSKGNTITLFKTDGAYELVIPAMSNIFINMHVI